MDAETLLGLAGRWMHVLAAITAVGGTIFARVVLVPALDELPPDQRAQLHRSLRSRWSAVVAVAIGFLLISGLYNIGVTSIRFRLPPWYMGLFVVKFVLALAVFGIASLLAGKTPLAERMRFHLRFWLSLNIALAVTVVCLSGVLRLAERVPKQPTPPPGEPAVVALPLWRFADAEVVD